MPGIPRATHNASFDPSAEACPVSTLCTHLKQVERADLNSLEAGLLNAFFAGFVTGIKPPKEVARLVADLSSQTGLRIDDYDNRILRRYDGDRSLPAGRYFTICADAGGNDGGTFVRELQFYADPERAEAHIEIYDPGLPDHVGTLNALGMNRGAGERIVLRVLPFAQVGERDFPWSYTTSIPIAVKPVEITGVLDLRRPDAAQWLCRTVSRLTFSLDGDRFPCFLERPALNSFSEIIHSLLDQAKGGGNFHIIVGLYLRQLGVSGLVFPSARSNAHVEFSDGVPTKDSGWSFVDYREAPPARLSTFFELRPGWPAALILEGGDHNQPGPVAFSDQVSVLSEGYETGHGRLVVRGLENRTNVNYLGESMKAAFLFRMSELRKDGSDADELIRFLVQLPCDQARTFASMVLFSLLGSRHARDEEAVLMKCAEPPSSSVEAQARHLGHVLTLGGTVPNPPEPSS